MVRAWLGAALWIACLTGIAAAEDPCLPQQPCVCAGPRYPLLARWWPVHPTAPAPAPARRNQSPYGTPAYAWGYFGATPTVHATQQWDYYHDWKEWTLRRGD